MNLLSSRPQMHQMSFEKIKSFIRMIIENFKLFYDMLHFPIRLSRPLSFILGSPTVQRVAICRSGC
jgi:hypothetical protein